MAWADGKLFEGFEVDDIMGVSSLFLHVFMVCLAYETF